MSVYVILAIIAGAVTVAIVASVSARRVMAERQEAQRVRAMFSRYVSPIVVDEILARRDPRIFSGRAGYATILVCRIWNFSRFAEQLTPEETLRYLNEFYTLTGKSVYKHRGMIDKFLPDGMVAAFGLPLEDPIQEEHALRAALDIIRLVDAMNTRWALQGRKPFRVGIGINSGTVIAGDTGYQQRREYAVVGAETLIAYALQEQTERMSAYIIASNKTIEPVTDIFATAPLRTLPLRGMRQNVQAHVIRGLARHLTEESLLLPKAAEFRTTEVDDEPLPPEPPAPIATPVVAGAEEPAPPFLAPPPPAIVSDSLIPPNPDEHPFDIKETRQRFTGVDDDEAAFPDAPIPSSFFEDDSGRPPLRLPP